jgi:ligand-binding sensor domain-containing protein
MGEKIKYYINALILAGFMIAIAGCVKPHNMSAWIYCTPDGGCITPSHSYGAIYSYNSNGVVLGTDSGIYSNVAGYKYLGYHINAIKSGGTYLSTSIWMATTAGVKIYSDLHGVVDDIDTPGHGLASSLTYDLLLVDSTFWVTTSAGLSKYFIPRNQWTNYTMPGVHNMTMDINHDIWVTSDNGLKKYDGIGWTSYTVADGLPANGYKRILASTDGYLYIQVSDAEGGGFIRYNNGSWTRYRVSDGLLSDSLGGWAQDNAWTLWICTRKGISVFDGSSFSNLPIGHQSNGQGLPSSAQPQDITTDGWTKYVTTTNGYITIPSY